jgi:hypothetical protein
MSEDKVKNKRKIRNDIIFIAILLTVIIMAIACLVIFRTPGDTVTVLVDGKEWGKYSLSDNKTVKIQTVRGTNILVIKDKKAYVESASCPDGICSSHRPIEYDGESIICLPNKVVISTSKTNRTNKPQPDIVVV